MERSFCAELLAGVAKLLASLGHTGRRVDLGHALNSQTPTKTDEQEMVLDYFMVLCWAAFIAVLGHMWPVGCGLDTPARLTRSHRPCGKEGVWEKAQACVSPGHLSGGVLSSEDGEDIFPGEREA